MILEIQYQNVFKTKEQDENDPHKLKAIVFTTAGDIETSWAVDDPEPDFGARRSFYIWFERISVAAKKELEQMEPAPDIRFSTIGAEYKNKMALKVRTDKQVPKEALQEAIRTSEMLAGYYTDWQADLRQNGFSGIENRAPFPFNVYRTARDIITLAERGVIEKRENFKLGKGKKAIDQLLEILSELRSGTSQEEIAKKFRFDNSLWHKTGAKRGLGKALVILKAQVADEADEIKDYQICAFASGLIDEVDLDLHKDVNRRFELMGAPNDRGGWNKE